MTKSRKWFDGSMLQILAVGLLAAGCSGSDDSASSGVGGSSIRGVPFSGTTSDTVKVTFNCDVDFTLNDTRLSAKAAESAVFAYLVNAAQSLVPTLTLGSLQSSRVGGLLMPLMNQNVKEKGANIFTVDAVSCSNVQAM